MVELGKDLGKPLSMKSWNLWVRGYDEDHSFGVCRR